MKIDPASLPFLRGEVFSNNHDFTLIPEPGDENYLGRIDFLCRRLAGKRVIHVGFLDHNLDEVRSKIERRKWLHSELLRVCERVAGIDIDSDAVARVQKELDLPDLYATDVTKPLPEALSGASWDVVLLGEVIEHIPNPADFLSGLKANAAALDAELIVTTPNGLSPAEGDRYVERINSDHRYIFTPFTLSKVLTEAGFEVERVEFCRAGRVGKSKIIENAKQSREPLKRSCLVVSARAAG